MGSSGISYRPSTVLSPLVLLSRTTCCSRRLRRRAISTGRGSSFAAFRDTLSEVTARLVAHVRFEGGVIIVVIEQGFSTDAASQYKLTTPQREHARFLASRRAAAMPSSPRYWPDSTANSPRILNRREQSTQSSKPFSVLSVVSCSKRPARPRWNSETDRRKPLCEVPGQRRGRASPPMSHCQCDVTSRPLSPAETAPGRCYRHALGDAFGRLGWGDPSTLAQQRKCPRWM